MAPNRKVRAPPALVATIPPIDAELSVGSTGKTRPGWWTAKYSFNSRNDVPARTSAVGGSRSACTAITPRSASSETTCAPGSGTAPPATPVRAPETATA
ncbi:MAG: hypothetical protein IPK33_28345 [Gemmatimonadetes bacterium]|nr:hypothetical protein [Gemmatimonadota bacterium]